MRALSVLADTHRAASCSKAAVNAAKVGDIVRAASLPGHREGMSSPKLQAAQAKKPLLIRAWNRSHQPVCIGLFEDLKLDPSAAKGLGRKALEKVAQIVRPETLSEVTSGLT